MHELGDRALEELVRRAPRLERVVVDPSQGHRLDDGVRGTPADAAVHIASPRDLQHLLRRVDCPYPRLLGECDCERARAAANLEHAPSAEVAGANEHAEELQPVVVDRTKLEPRTARHARAGRVFLRVGLPRERGRRKWQQRVDRALGDADVILTPGLAQPPLPARDWAQRGWLANMMSNALAEPFCAPWNLAGWPAIAVPAGLDPRGLPLGVQLVTRPGGEARLLSLAGQLEEARPWQRVAESLA